MESSIVYLCQPGPSDTPDDPAPHRATRLLRGTRILVIEDEFLIATVIEDVVRQAGAQEVIIAVNMQEARVALAERALDLAIIDMHLDEGSDSGLILGRLAMGRDIPFVFLTGYTGVVLPDGFTAVPVLTKPYIPRALVEALGDVLARAGRQP